MTGHRLDSAAHPTSVLTWREIEVELVDASELSLKTVGKHLRRHGARRSTSPSKVSRVLGVTVAGPDIAPSGCSAGARLVDYVRTHTGRLLALDPQVRFANSEDESVHQMRVAARSIYYALRTHQRLIDAEAAPRCAPNCGGWPISSAPSGTWKSCGSASHRGSPHSPIQARNRPG